MVDWDPEHLRTAHWSVRMAALANAALTGKYPDGTPFALPVAVAVDMADGQDATATSEVTFIGPTLTAAQFYASRAGGSVLFNASTGVVTVPAAGGPVAAFGNPASSDRDLHVHLIAQSMTVAGRVARFRDCELIGTGAPAVSVNRGGGTATAKGLLAPAGAFTASGGRLGRTTFVAAYSAYEHPVDGTIILRPGQNLVWFYDPDGSTGAAASIEVVWWETAAEPA